MALHSCCYLLGIALRAVSQLRIGCIAEYDSVSPLPQEVDCSVDCDTRNPVPRFLPVLQLVMVTQCPDENLLGQFLGIINVSDSAMNLEEDSLQMLSNEIVVDARYRLRRLCKRLRIGGETLLWAEYGHYERLQPICRNEQGQPGRLNALFHKTDGEVQPVSERLN